MVQTKQHQHSYNGFYRLGLSLLKSITYVLTEIDMILLGLLLRHGHVLSIRFYALHEVGERSR